MLLVVGGVWETTIDINIYFFLFYCSQHPSRASIVFRVTWAKSDEQRKLSTRVPSSSSSPFSSSSLVAFALLSSSLFPLSFTLTNLGHRTGKKVSYESMNPHTQASLLKAFLKELADPVFTAKLYPGWIAGTTATLHSVHCRRRRCG